MHRRSWRVPLAWLLIIVASGTTAGQSALGEDTAEQAIEIPGSGVGVTLPLEWRTWSFTDDQAREGIYASDVRGKRTCVFKLLTDVASAAAGADETVEAVSHHKAKIRRTTLEVPIGTAVRVSYRYESLPDEPRFVQHEYYLDLPSGVVSVYCAGDEPPADSWLSIIEAIAPVTADSRPPAPFDPRVEVADHGFALDFPAEWLVRSWVGPGPVLGGELRLRAVTLQGVDGSGGYECLLEDDTGLSSLPDVASLDDWRDTLISIAEEQKRRASKPVVTEVGLPSGSTIRADWEQWSEMPATAWIFTDGDRRAALLCRSDEPPDDRWGSVAASFMFLPDGESVSPEPLLDSRASQPTEPPSADEVGRELASALASLPGARPEVETWSGSEWVARLDPALPADPEFIRRVEDLVAAADASLDDLTIATALFEPTPGNIASVATVRIPGMRAFDLLDPVIAAMEPQIAEPALTWHRSADHLIARVYDGTMPGVYPVTLYPLGDTVWLIGADLPLVEAIVAELPTQLETPSGVAATLPCEVLEEARWRDPGVGNPDLDKDYLARCVTCDELIDLVNFHRVADVEMGLDLLAQRCDMHLAVPLASESPSTPAAEPAPFGSPLPLGAIVRGGRIEMEGSGFTITVPSDWVVEVAAPDVDHASQPPGTAWEALRADAPDRSMTCSISVGVTETPPGQWLTTGQDGVTTPYWDPMDPSTLWVPSPEVPGTRSVHMADWDRRQTVGTDLDRIVHYSLVCAADDTRVSDPERIFEGLMASFSFLPVSGPTASATTSPAPLASPLAAERRLAFPEEGVAVSVPADWQRHWDSPSLPIFEPVLAVGSPDGTSECLVETFAFDGVEASQVAETLGRVGGYDEFEISEAVALPAGDTVRGEPTVRMSAQEALGGQPGTSVAYVLAAPHGYAWLWCSTTGMPPSDDWLSIAETFELLPEE